MTEILNNFSFKDIAYIISILIFIAITMILHGIIRKSSKFRKKSESMNSVFNMLNLENTIEKNITDIISDFCTRIDAKEYLFYIFDNRNNNYQLKAVLHEEDNNEDYFLIYSGYRKYARKALDIPPTLDMTVKSDKIDIRQNGKLYNATIPIKSGRALVIINEIKSVKKVILDDIRLLQDVLAPVTNVLIKKEHLENEIKNLSATNEIMKNVPDALMNHTGVLRVILGTLIKSTEALGGFIIRKEKGLYFYEISMGMDKSIEDIFKFDNSSHEVLGNLVLDKDFAIVKKEDTAYYDLPDYFAVVRMSQLFVFRVKCNYCEVLLGFWHNGKYSLSSEQKAILSMISDGITQIFESDIMFDQLKQSNLNVLKTICNTIDNLTPYTVGYSKMMKFFSEELARALNMSEREISEIGIAAYLAHVGVAVLSNDIHYDKTKYSQEDYEMMKIHVDVGAAVVETALGSKRIAEYIKYHHERYDGNGYPEGLKGDNIPTGAVIIHIVQFFLAKVRGRKYRSAISYEEALNSIKSAVGTQIAPDITDVFLDMMNKIDDFTCWKMRGNKNICELCPAYKRTDKPCWMFENNSCKMHGSNCETCFIYTKSNV